MKPPSFSSMRSCILILLLALLLVACGEGATVIPSPEAEIAQEATAVPVAATIAPAPATETPLPTDTLPPPTDAPEPAATADQVATEVAIQKAAAATLTAEVPTATATVAPTDTVAPTSTSAPTSTLPSAPTQAATNTPKPKPKPKVGKILFTSNRVSWDDVFVMDDDGANVKQLTEMGQCYSAHFSPNGKRIVFDHEMDIWAMNVDGSGATNLTDTTDNIEAFPVFSSDGKRIAFLFGWPGGFEIYVMNADGSDRRALTSQSFDWMPAWKPKGNKIAFSSLRDGMFNIWTINADGSDLKQVTTFGDFAALSPVWSADGKQIGMVRYAGNSWEIWAVNADGSNPHKVTQIVGGDDGYIPDMGGWKKGQFVFGGYHGNWDVATVAEGGGETSFLTDHAKDDKPSDWWVP